MSNLHLNKIIFDNLLMYIRFASQFKINNKIFECAKILNNNNLVFDYKSSMPGSQHSKYRAQFDLETNKINVISRNNSGQMIINNELTDMFNNEIFNWNLDDKYLVELTSLYKKYNNGILKKTRVTYDRENDKSSRTFIKIYPSQIIVIRKTINKYIYNLYIDENKFIGHTRYSFNQKKKYLSVYKNKLSNNVENLFRSFLIRSI